MIFNSKIEKYYRMNGTELDIEIKKLGIDPNSFSVEKERARSILIKNKQDKINRVILFATLTTLLLSILNLFKH